MYANDFAPRDGVLRVHLIAHGEEPAKSDAFLLEYHGAYLLIDGGAASTDATIDYLLDLRRALLAEHPELIDDPACRLKLDLAATHCHGDHIGAWVKHILPSPYLDIGTLRLPPDSALDPYYHTVGTDGDTKFRPKIEAAIRQYHPQTRILTHDFGVDRRHSFRMIEEDMCAPTVTVCPAEADWGLGAQLEYIIDTYHDGDRSASGIPTQAVNNCSDWFHIRYGERTFLFTGDNVKKKEGKDDESADRMTALYLPLLGQTDVVKYIHHGYKRDPGAALMMAFEPQYVIIGSHLSTGGDAIRAAFPDSTVKILNFACQTYVLESDGHSLTVTASPNL